MSIRKITMPQLGESITEGTVTAWLVNEGDVVKKYDPIAEVQTDKVSAEVPSSFSGVVKEIVASTGDTIEVGSLMCYIEVPETDMENTNQKSHTDSEEKENREEPKDNHFMKKRYSPAVLQLSQRYNIDLNEVKGTGVGGRITRKDVEQWINDTSVRKDENKNRPTDITQQPSSYDTTIPLSGIRHAIATNMSRSKSEIPHAWMMVEADVTDLVSLREEIKKDFYARERFPITYFAFFVKAVAQALREYPMVNAMWAGDKIIQKKDINMSFAVGSEHELHVPVIKQADEKSIKGIAKAIYELAEKARNGQLTAQDVEGGTFTINNTGAFGSIQSMGIINYPQAAIIQVESIVKRPVVLGEGIAIRNMVNLCLSLDHRVLDGVICGKFLKRVKDLVEKISKDTTSIF